MNANEVIVHLDDADRYARPLAIERQTEQGEQALLASQGAALRQTIASSSAAIAKSLFVGLFVIAEAIDNLRIVISNK
jgi:hypothetical protein